MKKLSVIFIVGLLAGCLVAPPRRNLFQDYYQDVTSQWPASAKTRLLPPLGVPPLIRIFASENFEQEVQRLLEQGFALAGHADFVGALQTREQLVDQAKQVGAEFVLYSSEFSHTEQGAIPWISYQPGQTSTTHEYGTMTGSGSFGAYSGTATTTTPGTFQTQTIPISVQTFAQRAYFYRRLRPGLLGAWYNAIPDNRRAQLQRNTGAFIIAVIENSPAFTANVLRGDVIIQLNDKPISTYQDLNDLLPSYAGLKVKFTIIRDLKTITLDVQLNETAGTQ